MIRPRFHASITTAVVAGSLLVLAPAGHAATTPLLPTDVTPNPRAGAVEFGSSTWKLSGGAASKLKSAKVTVKGTGSGDNAASVKGSTIDFQAVADASYIDATTMKGAEVLDGGLSLKGKSKTVKLSAITVQPGIEKNVTAKLGSKLVELGTLKGGKATFSHQAQGDLKGATLSLSASGAKKLNAAVGGGFKAGSFATISLQAITRELPIASGVAQLTLDPALLQAIAATGASITATPPATFENNVVSIPISAGSFDPEELTGRMLLNGTVMVGQPGASVSLFGWTVIVTKSQHDLYAQVNTGVAAPLANINLAGLAAGTNADGTFYGTGGKLTLSKVAATVLTNTFHINEPEGTVMGTVNLSGQLSGKQ